MLAVEAPSRKTLRSGLTLVYSCGHLFSKRHILPEKNINVHHCPVERSRALIQCSNMKFYYVCIVLCSDGLPYTGITNDLNRRFTEHQKGHNK
jgi:hypothetical protein